VDGPESARAQGEMKDGNFVLLKINNRLVKTLVDTGANFSCVSTKFITSLRLQNMMVQSPDYKRLYTADGKTMKVNGTILLTLNIHGLLVPFTFYVLEHLSHNLIMGVDFLTRTKANIDMATGVITFYDDLVGLNMTKGDEILLRTVNAVRIPPKSEALIPVSVPTFFKSKISLIEPAANLHYKNLALAKAIVLPKNNTTVCKILNPTDTHIFLKRRTTVAVIEKLSVDSKRY